MNTRKFTRRNFLKFSSTGLLVPLLSALTVKSKTNQALRISYPLSLDAFPIKYAERKGIFQANGLEVELKTMKSAERRNALAGGELDCMVSDLASTVNLVANAQANIAVTTTAFPRKNQGETLALLGSGHGYWNIRTIESLFKKISPNPAYSIAFQKSTDIEFATDQLLSKLGYKVNETVVYRDLDLATAFGFLVAGGILAAVLPEPLATLASEKNSISNGGSIQDGQWGFKLHNYKGVTIMPSVIVFHKKLIEKSPEKIESFYKAYNKAVKQANLSPSEVLIQIAIDIGVKAFQEIYPQAKGFKPPEAFTKIFEVPEFPLPSVLEKEKLEEVVEWALQKRYIRSGNPPSYDQIVDNRFLR